MQPGSLAAGGGNAGETLLRALVAERLGRGLLGAGLERLLRPPARWPSEERHCAVGSPAHARGFVAKHADVSPALAAEAVHQAAAQARLPALGVAVVEGRVRETARRLMEQKATPGTVDAWLAEAPPREAKRATAAYHGLLHEARAGETPSDVRARLARFADGAPGATDTRRFDAAVRFDAWQHDVWARARSRLRGEQKQLPSAGETFALLLDFFAEVDLIDVAGARLRAARHLYCDPITGRAWVTTSAGRLEVEPPEPGDPEGRIQRPRVFVRSARGKSVGTGETALRRHFLELFADVLPDTLLGRVRHLLGYPADEPATTPCPPLPARHGGDEAPEPCTEDRVPVAVLRALDLAKAELPFDWPAVVVRAVTASAGRTVHALRYRALVALEAIEWAVARGRLDRALAADLLADADLGERTRAEWRQVWRALRRLPVLRRAFRAGLLSYTKVRACCRVATPATDAAWCDFARSRALHVVEACAGAAVGDRACPERAKRVEGPPRVPDGMDPLLPIGTRVTEKIREHLTATQWATLERARAVVPDADDAAVCATLAEWYLVLAPGTGKAPRRDRVTYQRAPETRLPVELRGWEECDSQGRGRRALCLRAPTTRGVPGDAGGTGGAAGMAAFAWMQALGATPCQELPLPLQQAGQARVPAGARHAVEARDGARCVVPHCGHDGYVQYNHGRRRADGGMADPGADQHTCGPDNRGHALGQLTVLNRPDGGVWCLDGAGRLHDAVAPVARHLDRPLRRLLLAAAAAFDARSRAAPPLATGPPTAA